MFPNIKFVIIQVAEDKFKDRLAQVAREKLGLISKEKQLQLERKKKAMAFLNQIKGKFILDVKVASSLETRVWKNDVIWEL